MIECELLDNEGPDPLSCRGCDCRHFSVGLGGKSIGCECQCHNVGTEDLVFAREDDLRRAEEDRDTKPRLLFYDFDDPEMLMPADHEPLFHLDDETAGLSDTLDIFAGSETGGMRIVVDAGHGVGEMLLTSRQLRYLRNWLIEHIGDVACVIAPNDHDPSVLGRLVGDFASTVSSRQLRSGIDVTEFYEALEGRLHDRLT